MPDFIVDTEVFPNFFCATFQNILDGATKQFVVAPQRDERRELASFLNQAHSLISFNGLSYDEPILIVFLRAIRQQNINEVLFKLSGRLIAEGNHFDEAIREVRWADRSWKSIDLLKIMAFDKKGVSLKQTGINLGWPLIQDLPLEYDAEVQVDQYQMVLDYNLNDVGITNALYNFIVKERKLRDEINQIYHVDVTNASRSKMANILLEKFYSDATRVRSRDLKDLRTNRDSVAIKDCIPADVEFEHPVLVKLLEELKEVKVKVENHFAYSHELYFEGMKYQLGIGGLHSVDTPAKYIATDEYHLIDVDVSSYYPSMMTKLKIKPAHMKDAFLDVLDMIRQERLEAKHQGNKTKAEALKITINSIYGKLGSIQFWLYDPLAMLQVTIAGQLYLLMLIEGMYYGGIEVLSANTDGVTVRVKEDQLQDFDRIKCNWEQDLGYELEATEYSLIVKRDVNNYIAQKLDSSLKEKGIFDTELNLEKMNNHPIIARALREYFINKKSIEETIYGCQNILDFTMSQKTGSAFQTEYHTRKGIELLQKTTRFYASNLGGAIIKRNRETGKEIGLLVGQNVRILNKLDKDTLFEKFDVDHEWYIRQVYEVVDLIEPRFVQLSFV